MVNISTNKGIIHIILILTIVIVSLYVIDFYWPEYENHFFELGLIGDELRTGQYFRNNKNILHIGTPVNWNIYMHNRMGTNQRVLIKVKLLDSLSVPPNDKNNIPSSEVSIIEYYVVMDKDQIIILPFKWSIIDAEVLYDFLTLEKIYNNPMKEIDDWIIVEEKINGLLIKEIIINGKFIEINKMSISGNKFRMVFELWVYDTITNDYHFKWKSDEDYSSASAYIWFYLNITKMEF